MNHGRLAAWAAFLLGFSLAAHAAPPVETINTNLDPLIDQAAQHPTRFTVPVAKRVTSERNGTWHTGAGRAVWEYAIRIPGAVSMGFHAAHLHLPAGGTLSVTAGGQTYSYAAAALRRSELWSRVVRGDTLAVTISVPAAAKSQTQLDITEFQAGYRSLGGALPDNPYYRSIKAQAAGSGCVENYMCDASSSTQNASNASVALIINNEIICSGTLLNDVPQDGKPYILTARHCENGDDGGGAPSNAAAVQVYWHATTPCGQALQSVFDVQTPINYGATTVVEQQDQWLIVLDAAPSDTDAYFAGWDASGATVTGGYTIDYSLGETQQYTTWAGSAYTETVPGATLGLGYSSVFLGTVNSLGSVDHGASGSALFTANNQLAGSLSRAVVEQCPVTPPPTPSASSASTLFSKLAATWTSTADTTSTTGAVTLASVLDPAHTGATSLDGQVAPPVIRLVAATGTGQTTGSAAQRSWNTASATPMPARQAAA